MLLELAECGRGRATPPLGTLTPLALAPTAPACSDSRVSMLDQSDALATSPGLDLARRRRDDFLSPPPASRDSQHKRRQRALDAQKQVRTPRPCELDGASS